MAVFFAEVETIDASPHDFLFSAHRPCASAVGRLAFAADQQLGQRILAGIFALLGFGADLLDLAFGSTPCQFFLQSGECGRVDDCRVIVLYIILRAFPGVDAHLFADAVLDIGFSQQGVPLVLFIGEDGLDDARLPNGFSHRRGYAVSGQLIRNLLKASAREEPLVNLPYCYRLFGNDLRLSISPLAVAEEGFIGEGHISFLCAPCFSPSHIVADVFRFALCDGAVDGDVKFRSRNDAVQVLFLEVHIHFDLPQHPGDFDAVKGVPRKPADGFYNNHVHLAAPALAD